MGSGSRVVGTGRHAGRGLGSVLAVPFVFVPLVDQDAAVKQGRADMKFVLNYNEVDEEVQRQIFHASFTSR